MEPCRWSNFYTSAKKLEPVWKAWCFGRVLGGVSRTRVQYDILPSLACISFETYHRWPGSIHDKTLRPICCKKWSLRCGSTGPDSECLIQAVCASCLLDLRDCIGNHGFLYNIQVIRLPAFAGGLGMNNIPKSFCMVPLLLWRQMRHGWMVWRYKDIFAMRLLSILRFVTAQIDCLSQLSILGLEIQRPHQGC